MTFSLSGDDAEKWFRDYIGYTVELGSGARPEWRGVVWEMSGSIGGLRVARSLHDTYNAIRTVYKDGELTEEEGKGRIENITDWLTDDQSIEMYGRRELALTPGWEMTASNATRWAARELLAKSRPYVQIEGVNAKASNTVYVTVVGMQVPANNMYVQPQDFDPDSLVIGLSTRIGQLAAMLEPWLTLGTIQDNSSATFQRSTEGTTKDGDTIIDDYTPRYGDRNRLWNHIQELTKAASLNTPWVADSWNGAFRFQEMSREPRMIWSRSGLRNKSGGAVDWTTIPAVFRDNTRSFPGMLRGTVSDANSGQYTGWLLSSNDTWVKSTKINLDTGEISFEPGIYSAEDAMDSFFNIVLPAELEGEE